MSAATDNVLLDSCCLKAHIQSCVKFLIECTSIFFVIVYVYSPSRITFIARGCDGLANLSGVMVLESCKLV